MNWFKKIKKKIDEVLNDDGVVSLNKKLALNSEIGKCNSCLKTVYVYGPGSIYGHLADGCGTPQLQAYTYCSYTKKKVKLKKPTKKKLKRFTSKKVVKK